MFRRGLVLFFTAIVAFSLIGKNPISMSCQEDVQASETEAFSEFSDSNVLVVIDRQTSLQFKSYDTSDFSEVDCIGVSNLTIESERAIQSSIEKGEGEEDLDKITFNTILCLKLRTPGKENVLDAISKLQKKDYVISAEPDFIISSYSTVPNDSYYNQQWGNSKISLPAAWDTTTGSSTVCVGIIDSGIDINSDFSGRIKTSWCKSFLTGVGVSETTPTDLRGHGTHVAGIIGAAGNNNIGISGVCWNVSLVSLKVIDQDGHGYASNVIAAIDYAESKKIPILNMSLGWRSTWSSYDSPMSTAINNYSGLLVCSAGNDSVNIETASYDFYPAKYSCSNMIVVGASTSSDEKASFSNYGTTSVDIFAPGVDILSTYPVSQCNAGTNNLGTHCYAGYHKASGTSMATPFVTGVAALIKSCHPNITVSQLKSAILNYGDYRSSLSSYCVTGKRLNASSSLESIHSYNYTDYGNTTYHRCVCSICGHYVIKPHNWVLCRTSQSVSDVRYVPEYYCSDCGAFTLNPTYP